MQSNKAFSARANETFKSLHPRAILGIKKRLMKRLVSQQFMRATTIFVCYLYDRTGAKNEIVMYYRPLYCKLLITAA